jgi:hypothetical protein
VITLYIYMNKLLPHWQHFYIRVHTMLTCVYNCYIFFKENKSSWCSTSCIGPLSTYVRKKLIVVFQTVFCISTYTVQYIHMYCVIGLVEINLFKRFNL